jgi:2-polyprenyl-3-methyl-5-hydroxy-6-metoxy-1,4-benzoquinol methylase
VRQQNRQHWEKIWSAADPREVTWYQDSPKVSLGLIEATGIGHEARILDVGCGASTLVDGLFDRGFENISMLDLSGQPFVRKSRSTSGMTGPYCTS